MKFRVFQNPDGSVRINRPNPRLRNDGETDDEFIARIGADTVMKDPSLAGLPFQDVDEADIPADRTDRHKWRLQQLGQKFVCWPDNTVPDRPHPKQPLIDRANSATTVAELKTILADLIRGT